MLNVWFLQTAPLLKCIVSLIPGMVESIVYHWRSTQYNVRLKNGMRIQVFEQNEEHFPLQVINEDDTVNLCWQKENVVILQR